jgi:hypothetical protein
VGADRHDESGNHVTATYPDPATDCEEEELQVGRDGAVSVHQDAEVGVHRGLTRGDEPTHLPDMSIVEFADLNRRLGVEVREPRPDLIETAHMVCHVLGTLPAFLKNDRKSWRAVDRNAKMYQKYE